MPVAKAAIARSGADPADSFGKSGVAWAGAKAAEFAPATAPVGAGVGELGDEADGPGLGRVGDGSGERTPAALVWGGATVGAAGEAGRAVAWGAAGTSRAIALGRQPPGRLGRSPEVKTGGRGETVSDGGGAGERGSIWSERLRDG